MFPLLALIRDLFQPAARSASERDEAYLAQAVDMADLERRMRQLDRGERDAPLPPVYGVFSH
jgi:hypothetical protein